jgi:hypothetical protein
MKGVGLAFLGDSHGIYQSCCSYKGQNSVEWRLNMIVNDEKISKEASVSDLVQRTVWLDSHGYHLDNSKYLVALSIAHQQMH